MAQTWPAKDLTQSLNQLFNDLFDRTDTLESSFSGTTFPDPVEGKLFYNTSDGNVYICTDATTPEWTVWSNKTAEITVTGSAADYIEFTGLDINTDRAYTIVFNTHNPKASDGVLYIGVEGNYTVTDYYASYLEVDGATVTGSRVNEPRIISIPSGIGGIGMITLRMRGSGIKWVAHSTIKGSAIIDQIIAGTSVGLTLTNVTTIRIWGSLLDMIDVDSSFSLYIGG